MCDASWMTRRETRQALFHEPDVAVEYSGLLPRFLCVRCGYESLRLIDIRHGEGKKDFVGVLNASPETFQRQPGLSMRVGVRVEDRLPPREVREFVPANHADHCGSPAGGCACGEAGERHVDGQNGAGLPA